MRLRLLAGALGLVAAFAVPAHAQSYPFEGKWDCEVAEFTFTGTAYHNGSETLPYRSVEKAGTGYVLTFADGYRIGLFDIGPDIMSWSSGASGDIFRCKRLE